MSAVVPGWLLAAETRKAVERHELWDGPAEFVVWRYDGAALLPMSVLIITADVDPEEYPVLMGRAAAEAFRDHPATLPVAYMLRGEYHGVTEPGPEAPPGEQMSFEAARRWRTFYSQPGAVEMCQAWCADVDGRLWSVTKIRGKEAEPLVTSVYGPADRKPTGQFITALLDLAAVTAEARAAGGAQ